MSTFSLNPRQLEAVQTTNGALLISAGAGSGKTQVLTSRIAHILSKGLAQPDQILAVTFTNKAAKEMSSRIISQIQSTPLFEPLWISTFHSACARILRENVSRLESRKQIIIYDANDQLSLVKKIMKDRNIDENYHSPKSFKQQINLCKRMALSPYELKDHPHLRFTEDFPDFYLAYEQALSVADAFDFEGLIFEVYRLFLNHSDILSYYQNKFKFISIDEYQDTNHIQYLLIKNLARKHQNICVVGDEDQSIYSWRGACISNILNFEKDFPNCKVVKLEQNYRSTNMIVSAASSLIRHNFSRKDKNLFTQNTIGEPIQVQSHFNDINEARYLAQTIFNLCEGGEFSYSDFAVFYRTNAQSRIIEDQLRNRGIAYQIIGNLKFYDRAEIKDMISYFRFILNPNDELSLRRIINSPKRGIGKTTIEKANLLSLSSRKPLYHSLVELAKSSSLTPKTSKTVIQFHEIMQALREQAKNLTLIDLYMQILKQSQYLENLEMEKTPHSESQIENLDELGNAIQNFQEDNKKSATLEKFLESMSLMSSASDFERSSVKLMTLHLSKGLEFDVVFITGWEEGLLPLTQNIEDMDVEEERRLAYVGITRAKKKVFLSYVQTRRRFGIEKKQRPSRFLKEISSQCLNIRKWPLQSFLK